jgi:hypothetical protein
MIFDVEIDCAQVVGPTWPTPQVKACILRNGKEQDVSTKLHFDYTNTTTKESLQIDWEFRASVKPTRVHDTRDFSLNLTALGCQIGITAQAKEKGMLILSNIVDVISFFQQRPEEDMITSEILPILTALKLMIFEVSRLNDPFNRDLNLGVLNAQVSAIIKLINARSSDSTPSATSSSISAPSPAPVAASAPAPVAASAPASVAAPVAASVATCSSEAVVAPRL